MRWLWLASLISYLGDTFGAMALLLVINDRTHSTAALAGVGLTQTLPLFAGVATGLLVDRWRYRPVLLAADGLRAGLVLLYILFQAAAQLWLVLAVVTAASVAARFFGPASAALRRALITPEEYRVAAALWQATLGGSYVIGPALAGVTIAAFGPAGTTMAFVIDSLSFLLSAALIFFGVRQAAQAIDTDRSQQEKPPALADVRAGWQIMWRSRPLRGVFVLYSVGLLGVGAVFVLVVPYVQRIFSGGPAQIGLLDAIQALGLALGAVGVGSVAAARMPAGNLMLGAALVGGGAIVALGMAPVYGAALGAMLIAGMAAGTVESAGAGIVLQEVPQEHQGKGSATLDTLLNAAYVTSIVLAGAAGDVIGIRAVFIVGGLVAVAGAVVATPLLWGAVQPDAGTMHDTSAAVGR
jgi:DHA3 family macrolide efflux protein-like MFS transporter